MDFRLERARWEQPASCFHRAPPNRIREGSLPSCVKLSLAWDNYLQADAGSQSPTDLNRTTTKTYSSRGVVGYIVAQIGLDYRSPAVVLLGPE
jgi:hypothetical protein